MEAARTGEDLGRNAALIRLQIERHAESQPIIVDLTAVLSISESFADEAFGVLVSQHGLEWFANRVRFLASEPILISIAQAIRERLAGSEEEQLRSQIKALVAARGVSRRHVDQ